MADILSLDEKLVILIEECAEVIKAATKCLRFGYNHDEPGYGNNSEILSSEIGDVLGMARSLPMDWFLAERSAAGKIRRAEKAKLERMKCP